MPKARQIHKRVKAVKSIREVTSTMEMVATSRFKKVHKRAVAARPYSDKLGEMVTELVGRTSDKPLTHPLLTTPDVSKDVLIVITSNRGLCAGYNSAVLRLATERMQQLTGAGSTVLLCVVGKRGIQYFRFRHVTMERQRSDFEDFPAYAKVSEMADELMRRFLQGQIRSVEVAYTQFISAGRQKPAISQILPLSNLTAGTPREEAVPATSYEFVPSTEAVLERLLPSTVRIRLYQCFLDAATSEQIARKTAMRAATDNADDMIHTLTVQYNRMRQAQITSELAEIIGGRAGVD
jgi:F-type H+-transporting ATPase subunit gamma